MVFRCVLATMALSISALASDIQSPLDVNGKIMVIDRSTENRISLFPDKPGFREARLFRLEDGSYTLEIALDSGNNLLRDRISMSATSVEAFRIQVSEKIARLFPQSSLDQKGRNRLINGIRVLSVGFYGWALPASFNVQNGGVAGGMYLVTAGTGFFLPLWMSRNYPITEGSAELALYGGYNGIAHAILLQTSFMTWERLHSQTVVATSMAMSMAEAYYLYRAGLGYGISGGQGRTMAAAGEFGLGIGLATAFSAGASGDQRSSRAFGLCGLAGSGLGFWAGQKLSAAQSYSPGDASLFRFIGGLGAYTSVSALKASGIGGEKALVNAGVIGAVSGLAFGHWLTSDRDISEGQAFLLGLGATSGGLFGLGVAYIARPNNFNNRMFHAASAIGATTGLGITWRIIRDDLPSASPPAGIGLRTHPLNLLSAQPAPLITIEARI